MCWGQIINDFLHTSKKINLCLFSDRFLECHSKSSLWQWTVLSLDFEKDLVRFYSDLLSFCWFFNRKNRLMLNYPNNFCCLLIGLEWFFALVNLIFEQIPGPIVKGVTLMFWFIYFFSFPKVMRTLKSKWSD